MSNLLDYELAALALDAYQRGYYAGMPDNNGNIDGLGSTLGLAVAGGELIATARDLDLAASVAADFYAAAYQIGNEVVISYRGSDHLIFVKNLDGSVHWLGADGSAVADLALGQLPDQAVLALEFFNHVKGLVGSTPITLTGHSLGGALAGLVGYLKNVPSVIFDNTAFIHAAAETAASALINLPFLDNPELQALVFGDVALEDRWSSFGEAEARQIALEGDIAGVFRGSNDVDNVDMGVSLDPFSAHIQALLVLALYAREQHGKYGC